MASIERLDERTAQGVAVLCTIAMLAVAGWLLMARPPAVTTRGALSTMRVYFVQRPAQPSAVPPSVAHAQPMRAPHAPVASPARAAATVTRTSQAAPIESTQAPAVPSVPASASLYTPDGRVRIPDASSAPPGFTARPPGEVNERELADAKRILERKNPIDYQESRFEQAWASDGNLLQRADDALSKAFRRKKRGGPATARPPPDIAINPALHENVADLGSEATGDAYKAAPIRFEKVPDLAGGASRRISDSIGALQARAGQCAPGQLQRLLGPVRTHLEDLRRNEYALAHGADPIRAEQMIPRAADSAYDLARRALWYAEHRLGDCLRPA
jgi:hypothetical protein